MARTTVEAQQTEEPVDPSTRNDNLDAPLDARRDAGAYGEFGDRAIRFSPVLWASTHRGAVAAAAGLAGMVTLGRWWRRT